VTKKKKNFANRSSKAALQQQQQHQQQQHCERHVRWGLESVEGTEEGREAACREKSIFRVADEKIVLGFLPSVMVSHILTFWGWVQKEQQQHQVGKASSTSAATASRTAAAKCEQCF
jgi:hypothetical protein